MPILKRCLTCERLFKLKPSQENRRTHCSKPCQYRRVTYQCEMCGKLKTVRPSQGAKRFCSNTCRLRWFANHFRAEASPHWKNGFSRSRYGIRAREIWIKHHGLIPKGMVIHHRDGNFKNNSIDNLQMVSIAEHMRIHKGKYRIALCQRCHNRLDQPFRRPRKSRGNLIQAEEKEGKPCLRSS